MERQKRLDEQEIEQQIAKQKAKDKAFAYCQYPKKFLSNTKLHKHIVAHHTKPPLLALATSLSSSSVLPMSRTQTELNPLSYLLDLS